MPLQPIPFASQSYLDPSRPLSVQRLVNMYLQPKSAQSKSQTALHSTPGLKAWASAGDGPCRGMHPLGAYLYVVSGQELYRVDSSGTATLVNVISGYGAVSMTDNGTHVVISTLAGPIYAANDTEFAELTVSNANGVAYQDGYVLYTERGSQKLFISALGDALTWDPLDFSLVNADPDNNVGIANLNRETWVFGEHSAQVYYNSGAADFPFSRNPSGVVERGCIASGSIAAIQGIVLWLGDDLRVYRNEGYAAIPVSTTAIDTTIAELTSWSDAIACAYAQRGHIHYVLTFPGKATFAYDLVTGLWHERQTYGRNDWLGRWHSYQFNRHIVGSAVDGDLYELDHDTFTDDGATIRRVMTSPPLHGGRTRVFMSRFEVDCEFGVGVEGAGQGSDPNMMLRWTDDGGRTYSNELWRKLGKSGDYRRRSMWCRLGSFRQRSLEISISDPVKSVIIDAYADISVGGST